MAWTAGELRFFQLGSRQKARKRGKKRIIYKDMPIPAPYDRILCQLIAENEHGNISNGHEARRRQSYAREVLDKFCEEYTSYTGPIAEFRSTVLSPILQRHLVGLSDSYLPSVATATSGNGDDPTVGEVTALYLGTDPTDPELIPSYRHNALFVPEMRWHLGIVMGVIEVGDESGHNRVWVNHDVIVVELKAQCEEADCEPEVSTFDSPMVKVIINEKLEAFFEPELRQAVCISHILCPIF